MQTTLSSVRTYKSSHTPTDPEKLPENPRSPKRIRISKFIPWLVVVVLIGLSAFLFVQYRAAQSKLSNASSPDAQSSSIVAEVAKILILPTGEEPTVITVAKAEELRDQSFFINAKNGDKVIVYSAKKRAILYRPSTNQIVNVESVTISSQDSTSTSTAQ